MSEDKIKVINRRPTILGYRWNGRQKNNPAAIVATGLDLKPGVNMVDAALLERAAQTKQFQVHVGLGWLTGPGLRSPKSPPAGRGKKKGLKGARGKDGVTPAGESEAETIARIQRSNDIDALERMLEQEERQPVSEALIARLQQLEGDLGDDGEDSDEGDQAGDSDQE